MNRMRLRMSTNKPIGLKLHPSISNSAFKKFNVCKLKQHKKCPRTIQVGAFHDTVYCLCRCHRIAEQKQKLKEMKLVNKSFYDW